MRVRGGAGTRCAPCGPRRGLRGRAGCGCGWRGRGFSGRFVPPSSPPTGSGSGLEWMAHQTMLKSPMIGIFRTNMRKMNVALMQRERTHWRKTRPPPRAPNVIRRGVAAVVAGMKTRSQRLLAICAIAAAAAVGQAAGVSQAASAKTVTLRDIAFSPKSLTVSRGATVTFRWRDGDTPHNVTSRGAKRFTSIATRESGSRSRTFTKAGTYRYVCTLHPGMAGRITVR